MIINIDKILGLYSFYANFGRQGDLEGLFICKVAKINKIIGKDVYFGEVLGKHSDVTLRIDKMHIHLITNDQNYIKKTIEIFMSIDQQKSDDGTYTLSGYNPIEYFESE